VKVAFSDVLHNIVFNGNKGEFPCHFLYLVAVLTTPATSSLAFNFGDVKPSLITGNISSRQPEGT
jgi:hypothetical protein